jgi:hypothetical protein
MVIPKLTIVHGEIDKSEITSGYEYHKYLHVPDDIKAARARRMT